MVLPLRSVPGGFLAGADDAEAPALGLSPVHGKMAPGAAGEGGSLSCARCTCHSGGIALVEMALDAVHQSTAQGESLLLRS